MTSESTEITTTTTSNQFHTSLTNSRTSVPWRFTMSSIVKSDVKTLSSSTKSCSEAGVAGI
jgi:hypothetical protein